MNPENNDFKVGEADGRKDGGNSVKPLSDTTMQRFYSKAYQDGYAQGHAKASEPRRLRAEGKV